MKFTHSAIVALLLIALVVSSSVGVTVAGANEERCRDDWNERIKVENTPENDPEYMISKAIREGKKAKGREGESGTPPVTNSPPSSDQLKTAINEGYNYVDKLYQVGVGSNIWDAVKEYPASPVGIQDRTASKWVLAGQDGYSDIITYVYVASDYELLDYKFIESGTGTGSSPYLWVDRYYYTNGDTKLIVSFRSYSGSHRVDIYFYKTLLWVDVGSEWGVQTKTIWVYSFNVFPAYRYTTRHGSQISANMYRVWGTKWSGYYLDRMLSDFGFTYDIYDPCWKLSNSYPDNFFFLTETYHDIDIYGSLPRGYWYYPYKSKVGINRDYYIDLSKSDPLISSLAAIHVMNKYNSLTTKDGKGNSALDYLRNGYKIDYYPLSPTEYYWVAGQGIKYQGNLYGIRLATFVLAETLAGYKFGDATSKSYADQAIEILYKIQIGTSGYFETADYGVVLRPQYRGGILVGYEVGSSYAYRQPKLSDLIQWAFDIVKIILGWSDMPSETKGVMPANLETTCVAVQAFRVYLYYKYGVAHPNNTYIP